MLFWFVNSYSNLKTMTFLFFQSWVMDSKIWYSGGARWLVGRRHSPLPNGRGYGCKCLRMHWINPCFWYISVIVSSWSLHNWCQNDIKRILSWTLNQDNNIRVYLCIEDGSKMNSYIYMCCSYAIVTLEILYTKDSGT